MFIDTVDVNEVEEISGWGVVSGCTTNPLIVANNASIGGKLDLKKRVMSIVDALKKPVSVELLSEKAGEMVEEARKYHSWNREYINIKVPFSADGLKVINVLERKENIRTNATCIMSFNQALLAALAGATYVSIFAGRIRDMGYDPAPVISDTAEFISSRGLSSSIIVGSVRHIMDVNDAFKAGAHIVTVTPDILRKMLRNPRTEETIKEFNDKFHSAREKGMIS
ncbi:MAG: transaldolase [Candidatus Omnitrophica bacterium]|nr:transaldolase [Candidatus Omnitrophota bacterium]